MWIMVIGCLWVLCGYGVLLNAALRDDYQYASRARFVALAIAALTGPILLLWLREQPDAATLPRPIFVDRRRRQNDYTQDEIDRRLLEFARWAIHTHRESLGDLDGSEIQDQLCTLGLLREVRVDGPCGESCACAEYYEEFPATCLRLSPHVYKK